MIRRNSWPVLQTSGVARVRRLKGQRGDQQQRVGWFTPGEIFADHVLKNLGKRIIFLLRLEKLWLFYLEMVC